MRQFILDLVDHISTGIVDVLSEPAPAAIASSLITLLGTLLIARASERRATERASVEYLRRRHDRFETVLDELVDTLPEWARDETALVAMYAKSMADDQDEVESSAVASLRQQVLKKMSRLRALAPAGTVSEKLNQLDETWSNCNSARKYLEHAIGPWELSDDEVSEAHHGALTAITAVEDALSDLVEANGSHVRRDG